MDGTLSILTLDTGLRLITIGAHFMLAIVMLFAGVPRLIKLSLVGVLLSATAYLINSSLYLSSFFAYKPIVDLMSVFTPFWAWLFALTIFEYRIRWQWIVFAGVSLFLGWVPYVIDPAWGRVAFLSVHIICLLLMGHLVFVALIDRADDLIEKRRKIRFYLPIFIGIQATFVLAFELFFGVTEGSPEISLALALTILLLTIGGVLTMLTTEPSLFTVPAEKPPATPDDLRLSPSDRALHQKLMAAMSDGFYSTPSLSISALAAHLGSAEHRLRALINGQMGYRNFSGFLNKYRIHAAQQKLADVDLVDRPILSIAMDLGYNSLATFNRAFRAETGQTPSNFRKKSHSKIE